MKRLHLLISMMTLLAFSLRYLVCCHIHLKINGLTFVTSQEMIDYARLHKDTFLSWLSEMQRAHSIEIDKWWKLSGKITSLSFLLANSLNLDKILFKFKLEPHKYSKAFIDMAITFAIGDFIDRVWFDINTFTWNDYIVIGVSFFILLRDILKIREKTFNESYYNR